MVKYTVNATQHPIFAEASLRGSELAVAQLNNLRDLQHYMSSYLIRRFKQTFLNAKLHLKLLTLNANLIAHIIKLFHKKHGWLMLHTRGKCG